MPNPPLRVDPYRSLLEEEDEEARRRAELDLDPEVQRETAAIFEELGVNSPFEEYGVVPERESPEVMAAERADFREWGSRGPFARGYSGPRDPGAPRADMEWREEEPVIDEPPATDAEIASMAAHPDVSTWPYDERRQVGSIGVTRRRPGTLLAPQLPPPGEEPSSALGPPGVPDREYTERELRGPFAGQPMVDQPGMEFNAPVPPEGGLGRRLAPPTIPTPQSIADLGPASQFSASAATPYGAGAIPGPPASMAGTPPTAGPAGPGIASQLGVPSPLAPPGPDGPPGTPPSSEEVLARLRAAGEVPEEGPDYTGLDVLDAIMNPIQRIGRAAQVLAGMRPTPIRMRGQEARARDAALADRARGRELQQGQLDLQRNQMETNAATRREALASREREAQRDRDFRAPLQEAQVLHQRAVARRNAILGQYQLEGIERSSARSIDARNEVRGMLAQLDPEFRRRFEEQYQAQYGESVQALVGPTGHLTAETAEDLREDIRQAHSQFLRDRNAGRARRRRRGSGGGGGGGGGGQSLTELGPPSEYRPDDPLREERWRALGRTRAGQGAQARFVGQNQTQLSVDWERMGTDEDPEMRRYEVLRAQGYFSDVDRESMASRLRGLAGGTHRQGRYGVRETAVREITEQMRRMRAEQIPGWARTENTPPLDRDVQELRRINWADIEFHRAVVALRHDLPQIDWGDRARLWIRQGRPRAQRVQHNLNIIRNQLRRLNEQGHSLGAQHMTADDIPNLNSVSSAQAILDNIEAAYSVKRQYVDGVFESVGYIRDEAQLRRMRARGTHGRLGGHATALMPPRNELSRRRAEGPQTEEEEVEQGATQDVQRTQASTPTEGGSVDPSTVQPGQSVIVEMGGERQRVTWRENQRMPPGARIVRVEG